MHAIRWHGLYVQLAQPIFAVEKSVWFWLNTWLFVVLAPLPFLDFVWMVAVSNEVLAYGVDDFIDSHCLTFAVHYLADDTLRQFQVYFFIVYGGMRHNGK